MKKIITLSILAMIFSLTAVTFAATSVEPVVDGSGVDTSTPIVDGTGVSGVNSVIDSPKSDTSGVDTSTPIVDGTGVSGSNSSLELPIADGSGVDTSNPIVDGSGVDSSSNPVTLPTNDGSGVDSSSTTTATSTATTTETVKNDLPSNTTPTNTVSGGSSFSGGGSGGSYYFLPTVLGTSTGSVLGASIDTDNGTTTCGDMFKTYMKKGAKNNKAEVVKLQKFLNKQLGIKLPITGNFGPATEKAVKDFQNKNYKTILTPWVEAGVMKEATSTGYFFKTTQYVANKMICSNNTNSFPSLK